MGNVLFVLGSTVTIIPSLEPRVASPLFADSWAIQAGWVAQPPEERSPWLREHWLNHIQQTINSGLPLLPPEKSNPRRLYIYNLYNIEHNNKDMERERERERSSSQASVFFWCQHVETWRRWVDEGRKGQCCPGLGCCDQGRNVLLINAAVYLKYELPFLKVGLMICIWRYVFLVLIFFWGDYVHIYIYMFGIYFPSWEDVWGPTAV